MCRSMPAVRPFLALMLGLSLVVGITPTWAELAPTGPEGAGSLRVQISAVGAARVAGDHETVTVTVTNTGPTPQQDVLAMLSLVDVTGPLATPLGLEDWTPAPEAAYAAQLLPEASVSRTWRLRMIQAGRVVVYATAVAGTDGSVTNSPPILLNVTARRNLTGATVVPVALGLPALALGGATVFLRRRRRLTEASAVTLLIALGLWAASLLAAPAASALTAPSAAPPALRTTLTVAGDPVKTGDRPTVTATVTNVSNRPVGATLMLGLVDMTHARPAPLGLETWTSDPEAVALPLVAPGESASATWHLVMIQPGSLRFYATSMILPHGPMQSSRMMTLSIRDRRILNPANILPVALGEPLLLLAVLGAVRWVRRARAC
jgi:hypothetical protein